MKKYMNQLKKAYSESEINGIIETAALDDNLTNDEYCEIYSAGIARHREILDNPEQNRPAKRESKKTTYARFGIKYENGKIYNPVFGWISPLLVNGNTKLGKGVYTWSMLPGTDAKFFTYDGEKHSTVGTCVCDCPGCYAKTGMYNYPSVQLSLAIKTVIARTQSEWFRNAVIAQIVADEIKLCRIHAAGDFFELSYIDDWRFIVSQCEQTVFWTYTKNPDAESAFDDLKNINIVCSVIPGFGFNFGKCGYIIKVYKALKEMNIPVYICRCGIDKNQHCVNCKGCSQNLFVLFIEHSTGYNAEHDPDFPELKKIIESQSPETAGRV